MQDIVKHINLKKKLVYNHYKWNDSISIGLFPGQFRTAYSMQAIELDGGKVWNKTSLLSLLTTYHVMPWHVH